MSEDESGERAASSLPVFGEGLETDVLREHDAFQFGCASEQIWIFKLGVGTRTPKWEEF